MKTPLKAQTELFSHARRSVYVRGTDRQMGNISPFWRLNMGPTCCPGTQ